MIPHIPWNKGMQIDRILYPNMGSFGKRTPEQCINISRGHYGQIAWNKGKHIFIGNNNPAWKNDSITYRQLHRWVKKQFINMVCENCGAKELKAKDGRTLIELANKTGIYTRDLENWVILCRKCHREFDKDRRTS